MAFNGKLVQLKTGANYVDFPLRYMKAESYKVTPDQRLEVQATRATTGVLHRNTVNHTASKIEFDTPPITNNEVSSINTLLSNAYTDSLQRQLDLKYYDPLSDSYKTGTFYVPDINFEINRVDTNTNTIYYNPIRIAFIEY